MNARSTLAVFALGLAGAFGIGAAVGAAVGPIDVGGEQPADHSPTTTDGGGPDHGNGHGG